MKKTRNNLFWHSTKFFMLPLFLLAIFTGSLVFGIIAPLQGTGYAAVADVQSQRDRTILYALIHCLEKNPEWKDKVNGDATNKSNIGGILDTTDIPTYAMGKEEVPVGYEIDGGNGQAKCNGISLTRALRFIDRTPGWFFNKIYDLDNPDRNGDDLEYKKRSQVFLLNNIKTLLGQKDSAIGTEEKQRRLAVAFWQCNEEVPDGQNPSRTHNTFGGKKYQLKEGKKSDNEISVGLDLERTNGKYECGTLINWSDKAEMAAALAANPPQANNGNGAGGGLTGDTDSCDVKLTSPISWIVCPIVDGINKAVVALDKEINSLLTVGTDRIFCTEATGSCSQEEAETGKRYYQAWNSFRTIALGLVVIAALVVIIASAFGYEILDAYTIRKVLPRLLIAIVFITLSWSVLEFLLVLTNDVGNGIRALIYQPFSGMDDVSLSGGMQIIGLLGVAAWGAFLGIIGLLSFGVTALLAVLIAFGVLILRELIIVFLIIAAPIGIACLILPNTRKGWQLWQNSLTAMLLVFPIIAAMIAVGRVFAQTAFANGEASEVEKTIAFIAYFLPYFMIPFAFRAAGGLMATLAGFANDRSRGAFDRLKNVRGQKMAENWNKTKNFSRFSDSNPIGRGINTAMGAAANPKSMLRGRGGVVAARSSRQKAYGGAFLKENEIFQANQGDDAFLLAVANRDLAKSKMNAARDKGDYKTAANYEHAINAAAQLGRRGQTNAVRAQALSALAKTGYQFDAGEQGYNQLRDTARSIAGNDDGAFSSLMNEAQYGLRTAGRYDLGGINHGAGFDGKSGTDKGSLYEIANGKKESIIQLARNAGATGAANTEAHAVAYQELKAMLPNAKGGNRDEILKQMSDLEFRGVKHYMNTSTGATRKQRVNFDNTDPTHTTGPGAWNAEERARGWRVENVNETMGDVAAKKARTYERPDPNNL